MPANGVLLNVYESGKDHVAWHADDEPEVSQDAPIASLSLGAARRFQVRRTVDHAERFRQELEPGSLLIMPKGFQMEFEHAVPAVQSVVGPRWNLHVQGVRGNPSMMPVSSSDGTVHPTQEHFTRAREWIRRSAPSSLSDADLARRVFEETEDLRAWYQAKTAPPRPRSWRNGYLFAYGGARVRSARSSRTEGARGGQDSGTGVHGSCHGMRTVS